MPNLSVKPSIAMADLLEKPHYSLTIARNYEILRDILSQVQLDIVNEDNRDRVGPTLLGLKHVQDVFLLFQAKGNALIAEERREDNRNNRNRPNATTTSSA